MKQSLFVFSNNSFTQTELFSEDLISDERIKRLKNSLKYNMLAYYWHPYDIESIGQYVKTLKVSHQDVLDQYEKAAEEILSERNERS